MAIDVELYTEGVVKQFQGWKTLKGPAAAAEVDKLLALLESMSKEQSPAVMDKLKVEWDALKTAKEKGFAPEQGPADANTPADSNPTIAPNRPANDTAPAPARKPTRPSTRRGNTRGIE
jgi:hypothetical protein